MEIIIITAGSEKDVLFQQTNGQTMYSGVYACVRSVFCVLCQAIKILSHQNECKQFLLENIVASEIPVLGVNVVESEGIA
jgi:hypothetical protein